MFNVHLSGEDKVSHARRPPCLNDRYRRVLHCVPQVHDAPVRVTPAGNEMCIRDRGCSVEDLLAWGEEIKPKAMMAYMGFGEYHAGSWCQFCRANGICKAQAAQQIGAFDDFKDAVESRNVALLSPDGMSDVLARGKDLVARCV